MASSHTLDQFDICFDDTHAVANAGLLLAATLAERLGIEQAADQLIDLGDRPGAALRQPVGVVRSNRPYPRRRQRAGAVPRTRAADAARGVGTNGAAR